MIDTDTLKQELKALVIEECDMDYGADEILDDERLIGSDCRLGLDSLDALTISLAVKDRYGKHIDSGNETRAALTSINHLAAFIIAE
jgi:acyl carrier protein